MASESVDRLKTGATLAYVLGVKRGILTMWSLRYDTDQKDV